MTTRNIPHNASHGQAASPTLLGPTLGLTLALTLVLALSGCNTNKPTTDFGKSVRSAVASQTLNPEPAGDAPVTGLDGAYGAKVAADYKSGGGGKQKQGVLESMLDMLGGGEEK